MNVESCDVPEDVEAFRRTGFDNSIIPQCAWADTSSAVSGGISFVNVVLANDINPVTGDIRQFFVEVVAKSTVLLGGLSQSDLVADQLNLTVSLVDYRPEAFQTAPLTDASAAQLAVYLDLRMDFPGALRYEAATDGGDIAVTNNTLVRTEYLPGTSSYAVNLRPNDRTSFKVSRCLRASG
eukprot:scaffold68130_cov37-Prasinocladus_malaysianus.AAC.1